MIGTTDAMTVTDWYVGAAHQVEQFKVDGNRTLLTSDVENLVQAMASFAPPALASRRRRSTTRTT